MEDRRRASRLGRRRPRPCRWPSRVRGGSSPWATAATRASMEAKRLKESANGFEGVGAGDEAMTGLGSVVSVEPPTSGKTWVGSAARCSAGHSTPQHTTAQCSGTWLRRVSGGGASLTQHSAQGEPVLPEPVPGGRCCRSRSAKPVAAHISIARDPGTAGHQIGLRCGLPGSRHVVERGPEWERISTWGVRSEGD